MNFIRNKYFLIMSALIICLGILSVFIIDNSFARELLNNYEINNAPIIGVLAQESYSLNKYFSGHSSFIAASYVKYLEGAGARVVPIWIGQEKEYYETLTDRINGILFPGGATWFNSSNGYADAGVLLYNIAKRKSLPILGICLGMELLVYAAADTKEIRAHCKSQSQALPLEFQEGYKESRLFKNAPEQIINILETQKVTINFHRFCITKDNMTKYNLINDWQVISLNEDTEGLTFISSMESKHYPFFGLQFHPEKNIFEWIENKNIPHWEDAIRASQYFSNFFINETRKNLNSFPNKTMEREHLIYNFPVTYTGINGSSYEQCYLFK